MSFKPGKQNLPPGYDLGTLHAGLVFKWRDVAGAWQVSPVYPRDRVVDEAWRHHEAQAVEIAPPLTYDMSLDDEIAAARSHARWQAARKVQ
jgi:hypothetical protein